MPRESSASPMMSESWPSPPSVVGTFDWMSWVGCSRSMMMTLKPVTSWITRLARMNRHAARGTGRYRSTP